MASKTEQGRSSGFGRPRLAHRRLVGREEVISRCVDDSRASTALLAAPAGYGKTTVLSQWEEADRRPFGWISLDDRYNDPALLVGSIAAALDEIEPLDETVLAPLQTAGVNLDDVVVPRLCEALAHRAHPFVLVLDDIHSLHNPESLRPLASVAESVPQGSKLALGSRDEPAISLGRLRAEQLLLELHAEDLAMTRAEASLLLEQAGLRLDPETVDLMIARTEGWPAGLYLAALALAAHHDVSEAVERIFGDDRFIADYLRDEFLAGLPDSDLDFLTRTSILEPLSGPLCDAVLGREGSANVLRRLSRSNLLLVPLDHRDHEYRYHALLREMLESELRRIGQKQEAQLHTRASEWYARESDVDHAVPHAIAARDPELAANLIWVAAPDYASTGREATIRRWLEGFTEDQVASSPPLCLARALTYLHRGNGAQVEQWTAAALEGLKRAPRPDEQALTGAAKLIRASGAATEGVVAMREDIESVYELIPDDSAYLALCRFIEGAAHHLTGDLSRARELLEEGARRGAATSPHMAMLCLSQLALIALDGDDAEGAEALADRATAEIDHFGLEESPTSALIFAAAALARATRGRAIEAARDAQAGGALVVTLHDMSPWFEAETRIVLARTLLLLDDVAGARSWLAEAGRYLKRTPDATRLRDWLEEAWRQADTARSSATDRWPLSPAELRLLRFLPTHLTLPEIAEELFVSANTVKTQARSIYGKLGVSSRKEAVACARTAGLLDSGEIPTSKSPS
jgi:LuxR family maltose regulon positive regulatory protein